MGADGAGEDGVAARVGRAQDVVDVSGQGASGEEVVDVSGGELRRGAAGARGAAVFWLRLLIVVAFFLMIG